MKLYIDKALGMSPENIRMTGEFTLFCADNLPIEGDFKIHMVSQREPHNIKTTALYEVGNNCCRIYCKNRAFAGRSTHGDSDLGSPNKRRPCGVQ